MSSCAAKHLITKNFRMQFVANETWNLEICPCEFSILNIIQNN